MTLKFTILGCGSSGGVPRLVNTLCDTTMLAASTSNRDRVGRTN